MPIGVGDIPYSYSQTGSNWIANTPSGFWRHVYIGVGIALLVIALFLSIIITMISLSNTDD